VSQCRRAALTRLSAERIEGPDRYKTMTLARARLLDDRGAALGAAKRKCRSGLPNSGY